MVEPLLSGAAPGAAVVLSRRRQCRRAIGARGRDGLAEQRQKFLRHRMRRHAQGHGAKGLLALELHQFSKGVAAVELQFLSSAIQSQAFRGPLVGCGFPLQAKQGLGASCRKRCRRAKKRSRNTLTIRRFVPARRYCLARTARRTKQ